MDSNTRSELSAGTEDRDFNQAVARLTASMPSPKQPHGYRQILIAYDGSQGARAAAERVAAIVTSETAVTVITVVPSEPIEAKPDSVDTDQSEWQWNSLAEATALLRSHGIRPFIEAAAGSVGATL